MHMRMDFVQNNQTFGGSETRLCVFVILVNIRIHPSYSYQREIVSNATILGYLFLALIFDSISFCSSFVIYQLLVMVSKQSPTLCTLNQHYYVPTLLIKALNDDYGWTLN